MNGRIDATACPVQALLDRTSYLIFQFRCATVRMTPANLSTVGRKSSTQGARKVLHDGHYWTEFHVDMSVSGQPVEGF
jgi:predicted NAD/FAD-binding protein